MHDKFASIASQTADRSIPTTGSQEACQGRLPLDITDVASVQHSTWINLPCHTDIVKPVSQQEVSSSEYASNTSRQLLAVEQAPDRTSEHDTATINTDVTSTAPHIELSPASDSKVQDTPTQDVVSVEDAAHQQAMQHGAGAQGTRELNRQLGQRFDRSAADHVSAQNEATAGQIPPEQSEITPGNGQTPHSHNSRPLCNPMPLLQSIQVDVNQTGRKWHGCGPQPNSTALSCVIQCGWLTNCLPAIYTRAAECILNHVRPTCLPVHLCGAVRLCL